MFHFSRAYVIGYEENPWPLPLFHEISPDCCFSLSSLPRLVSRKERVRWQMVPFRVGKRSLFPCRIFTKIPPGPTLPSLLFGAIGQTRLFLALLFLKISNSAKIPIGTGTGKGYLKLRPILLKPLALPMWHVKREIVHRIISTSHKKAWYDEQ